MSSRVGELSRRQRYCKALPVVRSAEVSIDPAFGPAQLVAGLPTFYSRYRILSELLGVNGFAVSCWCQSSFDEAFDLHVRSERERTPIALRCFVNVAEATKHVGASQVKWRVLL